MHKHQNYITLERAAETVLKHLRHDSRLIITGQIGCGKSTLAREISTRLGLTQLAIDDFYGDVDPNLSATKAASSIDGGWVAEANVWQIPQSIWELSDFAVFLDYANVIHYLRIISRCFRECTMKDTWVDIHRNIQKELLHIKIIYLYANKNRQDWDKRGGITNTETQVIRCTSPWMTNKLLERIGTTTIFRG